MPYKNGLKQKKKKMSLITKFFHLCNYSWKILIIHMNLRFFFIPSCSSVDIKVVIMLVCAGLNCQALFFVTVTSLLCASLYLFYVFLYSLVEMKLFSFFIVLIFYTCKINDLFECCFAAHSTHSACILYIFFVYC